MTASPIIEKLINTINEQKSMDDIDKQIDFLIETIPDSLIKFQL